MRKVLVLIFLGAIIAAFAYRSELYRLYKVMNFFEPATISYNFRNIREIFPTRMVPASSNPIEISNSRVKARLPESFVINDSVIITSDYLQHTSTDALLILHKDTIRLEWYNNGFKPSDYHISFSMSKSVVSALVGIAIDEGFIHSIYDDVTKYLPEFKGTGYEDVMIKDVLQMSSGVKFDEDYSDFNSDINVLGRYFALGKSMRNFALTMERQYEPGTFNQYVSVDTQILGMILSAATNMTVSQFMYDRLWEPLNATSDAFWIIDDEGMEFVIGGLNCTARDYARIGLLYLHEGNWRGQQIVPKDWVTASITPDALHLFPGERENAKSKDGYGYQWWIPYGAEDEFNAQGIYTQFIYVDPDLDMVIVKLSSNHHFKTDTTGYYHDHEIALYRKIADQFE